jgi:hypothetical protein
MPIIKPKESSLLIFRKKDFLYLKKTGGLP